jgi:hypothetical protein
MLCHDWRQAFDFARIDLHNCFPHTAPGYYPAGNNFGEGNKDECTLEQTRVRERQRGCGHNEIVISKQIDVDAAGTPAPFCASVASERMFALHATAQKRMRRKLGCNINAGIDEGRLILEAPGRRAVIRGAREQAYVALATQQRDGLFNVPACITEIAPEADECFRHAEAAFASR